MLPCAMAPVTLTLTGRVYRDAETGYYVSVVDGLDIATNAPTLDQVMEMTWDLIAGHLETARRLGVLERELGKLGVKVGAEIPPLQVKARLAVEGERRLVL